MLRLATLSAVIALSACANQGDEGFNVLNNTAVTTECTLTGDPNAPFISHGEIWTGSNKGYLLTPLLQSRIGTTGAGSGATLDPTTRTIYIKGANVTLEVKAAQIEHVDATGNSTFTNTTITLPDTQAKFSALVSAALPPAGSVNVAFEIIPVPTLRTVQMAAGTDRIRAELLATINMIGELNGDDVTAQPFTFPVTVCNDCVMNDVGACPATGIPRAGNPCNMFQDGVVDCCESDTGLICPASTTL